MKKHYLLSLLLASFLVFLSFHGVHAQGSASISGDELCGKLGGPKCDLSHLKTIFQKLIVTIVSVGSVLVVVFAAYRLLMAELAARQGDANARKQALKNILNGFIGIVMILGVFGGFFLLALKLFGVESWVTGLFRLISEGFIPHAYAANERLLPNPTGSYNIFDLILAAVNLVVKFFIYPAVVVLWVWSGFQFVYSRGNPAGLAKAKSWLLWSFIITVFMFTLQGFTLALRNTMMKIVPQNAALIQEPGTADGRGAPAEGAAGSACTTQSGTIGIRGTDGSCTSRSDSYANQPVTSCRGQNEGTPCTVSGRTGRCTVNEESVFGCYVDPVTSGGRTGVGPGGSCRIDLECTGTLRCVDSVCK